MRITMEHNALESETLVRVFSETSNGNIYKNHSKDPNERRRKLLEGREERMNKLLDSFSRAGDKYAVPCKHLTEFPMSSFSSRESNPPSTITSSQCLKEVCDSNIWHIPGQSDSCGQSTLWRAKLPEPNTLERERVELFSENNHIYENHPIDLNERRRKILEQREERMNKLLGSFSRAGDKYTVPCKQIPKLPQDAMPNFSSRETNPSSKITNSQCLKNSKDSNIWHIPFPVLIILSVVLIRMLTVLEIFASNTFNRSFSFMVLFFILECFYFINKSAILRFWLLSSSGYTYFLAVSPVLLQRILVSFEDMLLHFSIYFVLLCLMHIF